MNIHHLELFYFVARHGGIAAACREMPYGIQQPAVSAQIINLEDDLGLKLLNRRPFSLTPAGEELFAFAAPFFSRLPEIEARMRGEMARALRLTGLSEVMRDHAPELLGRMRERFPGLKVRMLEADQRHASALIQRGEADLAVTVLDEKLAPGFRSRKLAHLSMVLLVKADSPFRRAGEALAAGRAGKLDLISVPPHERSPRLFARELRRRKWNWPTAIEVSSAALVAEYAAQGLGAGLTAANPLRPFSEQVRSLPLKGFPGLPVGAFWMGKLPEPATVFLDELSERVGKALAKVKAG